MIWVAVEILVVVVLTVMSSEKFGEKCGSDLISLLSVKSS